MLVFVKDGGKKFVEEGSSVIQILRDAGWVCESDKDAPVADDNGPKKRGPKPKVADDNGS